MNKLISTLKLLVGWPLSFLAIIFLIKFAFPKLSIILEKISTINPFYVLLSITFFILYFLLRSFLWKKILEFKGHKISFKKNSYLWGFSEFKRYVPGNIWSFLSRVSLFSDLGIDKKTLSLSLLDEIQLIVFSSTIISVFCLPLLFNSTNSIEFLEQMQFIVITSIIGIIAYSLTVAYIFKKRTSSNFISNLFLPGYKLKEKIILIVISIFTFFVFGIANLIAAISIFNFNPSIYLQLISFFTFALLVGYLSFITPMGLGVREGIVTLGLSKLLGLTNAGFLSIFSRIVLIISEVIFLGIILMFNFLSKEKIISFLKKYRYQIVLSILILIYISYFTLASFLRYDNFFTGRFDLGNMDQTVWNTIHGRIFQFTDPDGTTTISRLAFHADFILILISPLYLIWSDPKMLLLLQTIVLALGAVFVFYIASEILKHKMLALTFSFLYLLNPSLQFANLYDFHAVTLATTLLLGTFYFFLKRKYLLFLFFAILAGLAKEQIWAIISIFGFVILLRVLFENRFKFTFSRKQIPEFVFGTMVFLISICIFYLLFGKIIPMVRGTEHFALSYYSDFGITPSGIVRNILFNPIKTISIVFSSQNIEYLIQLFSPVGFISLLNPFSLIFALPDFAINLLGTNLGFHQIYYQYTTTITPFVLISAIYGIRFIQSKIKIINNYIIISYLLIISLVSSYLYGPLPNTVHANTAMFNQQLENRKMISDFISKIPQKYSIAATNNLGSHLSQRNDIYTIPIGIEKADVIVFLLNDVFAQPSLTAQKQMAEKLMKNTKYTLLLKYGDFVAFQKKDLQKFK